MRQMRIGAVIRVATLFVAGGFGAQAAAQGVGEVGLPIGTTPDAVTIEDLDGNDVELSRYIGGKPAVLEFWAQWCENCEALMPELNRAIAAYGDRVTFLGIAVAVNQSKRSIRRHLDNHDIEFPLLWDTRGRATRAYMAPTTSYVAILGADGKVAYTGVGPEQEIVAALREILGETELLNYRTKELRNY